MAATAAAAAPVRTTSWPFPDLVPWRARDPVRVGTLHGAETATLLPLGRTEILARVVGPFAEVTVRQRFRNAGARPAEYEYVFPLPDGAAVREMEVRIGARVLRTDLLEREEARRTYEEALAAGHGDAIAEAERPNVVRLRLGNVEPGEEISTRFRYLDEVPYDAGVYRLTIPTVVGPRYVPAGVSDGENVFPPFAPPGVDAGHDLLLRVEADPGAGTMDVRSPSHAIDVEGDPATGRFSVRPRAMEDRPVVPDRDFVLVYRPADGPPAATLFTGDASAEGTPFVLVAHATRIIDAARPAEASRRVVFLLDTSGSMRGEMFDAARNAVRALLRALGPGDRFQLVRFSSDHSALAPAALPFDQASLDRAEAWLAGLEAGGGTEILPAVVEALRRAEDGADEAKGASTILVLVTDGQVANEAEVIRTVAGRPGVRVFTLGIDSAANSYLLRRLAAVGRGRAAFAYPGEDVEAVAATIGVRLGRPLASDLRLEGVREDGGALRTWPDPLPDLHAGAPVVAYGLFAPASVPAFRERARLRLAAAGGVSIPLDVSTAAAPEGLGALVAARRIEAILDEASRGGDAEGARREALRLALIHRIASPFTAFTAVEERETVSDTGARVRLRVPVHFPAGWSWEGVFGGGDAGKARGAAGWAVAAAAPASPSLLARARRYLSADASCAAEVGEGQAALSAAVYAGGSAPAAVGRPAASIPTAPPAERALRWLARTQRADGTWARGGRSDREATTLAALALLRAGADRPGHPQAVILARAMGALGASDGGAVERLAVPVLAAHAADAMTSAAAQISGGADDGSVGGDPLRTALFALAGEP